MASVFEALEASLLFGYLPAHGRLAVDVGANTGFWTRELAARYDTVHAYEPQAGITGVGENAEVFNFAIGANGGQAEFRLYRNNEHASLLDRPDDYGPLAGTLTVPLYALDDLYTDDVDFVKVDVEGSEVDVLRGAQRLMKSCRPTFMVEIHGLANRRQVLELLRGYDTTIIPNPVPGADPDYCWIHAS